MNKFASLVVIGMMFVGQAMAAETKDPLSPNQGSDTCGLGWKVTQNKTLLGTSTRGTTNSYLSPTWSMTSGTSGCEQHPIAKKDEEAVKFVAANYYPLTAEMAQGQGEYLMAFAKVMGCNDQVLPEFQSATQKNFQSITEGADAVRVLEHVKSEMRKSQSLAQGCAITS